VSGRRGYGLATGGQRRGLIQPRTEIAQMHQFCAYHRNRISPWLVTQNGGYLRAGVGRHE
jgi:hypothetical protein